MNEAHRRSDDARDDVTAALAQFDLQMRFVRVNASFAGLTGYHPHAHTGLPLRELAPAIASQLEPICSKVIALGQPASIDIRTVRRRMSDATRLLRAHCNPIRSKDGAVEGAEVVFEPLAGAAPEPRTSDAADDHAEAAALNRAVLNSLREHVAVIDSQGAVLAVNEAWTRFARDNDAPETGSDVGRNYLDVFRIAADRDATAAKALAGVRAVLNRSRDHFSMEYACDSSRERRRFVMTAVPLQRREGGAVITHTDITERTAAQESLREREEQLGVMIDALPLLVAYVDAEQRYRIHNRTYRKFFGVTADNITGRTVHDVLGDARYGVVKQHIQCALQGASVQFDAAVPNASGDLRQVHGYYVPHVGTDGKAQGYFALMWDITDRLHAEDENRRHREELAHMDRVSILAGLSASLAHELNQPLTAILNNAQAAQRLLARQPPDLTEVIAALADIIADDKRAGEVIRRLRVLLGKSEPQVASVDINGVVQEVAALVRSDALRRRITLRLELCDHATPVLGDRIQLQQVLLNLALNAFDAIGRTKNGPRSVILRTAVNDSDDLLLSVCDTGNGADRDILQRMFDPFFTTKHDGLGMGLAITKSIIESHGGRIWAAANPDRGLTVNCSLPIYRTDHG